MFSEIKLHQKNKANNHENDLSDYLMQAWLNFIRGEVLQPGRVVFEQNKKICKKNRNTIMSGTKNGQMLTVYRVTNHSHRLKIIPSLEA